MRPGFQSNFQANSKKRVGAGSNYVCTWRKPTSTNLWPRVWQQIRRGALWILFDETFTSTHH